MSESEVLDLILDELRSTKGAAESTQTQVARMDERITILLASVRKVEEAVFGNGKPGLRHEVEEQKRRLLALETSCNTRQCDLVLQLEDRVGKIEERHAGEDELVKEQKEEKKAEKNEWRKLRFSLIFFGATLIVDLVVRFFVQVP